MTRICNVLIADTLCTILEMSIATNADTTSMNAHAQILRSVVLVIN